MSHKLTRLKKFQLLKCVVVSGGLMAAGVAVAADAGIQEDSSVPVFRLGGGVSAYPGLSIVEKHNDNIYRSDADKKSSLITVVSPSVMLDAKKGANAYSLAYRADIGRYAQASAENYTDHSLLGVADLLLSTRAALQLSPEFKSAHEERGTTYAAVRTGVPNTFHNAGIAAAFTYGAEGAPGRIKVNAGYHDIKYQNNRELTVAYDKTLSDIGGAFYYRMSPKVSTFMELANTRIAYQQDALSTLSGDEQRVLLGATWDATAQTSGTFKIGQVQKKFDSASRQSYSGANWEGSVRWSPREYVQVEWLGSRRPHESTGVGDFVLVTNNALDLGYDLNPLTRLHLKAGKVTEDFVQSTRYDSTRSYGLKADYKLRRWLVMGAEYSNAVKTSTGYTGTSPNYTNDIFALSIRSEL